ncbi:hypothetical protein DL96DRAFT_1771513 [Flagelloscypha sp. PMI_526]|nr:hypothetical protein DL96DRAFT_1771513 [Flagelloscypha sp. PMI_526]
MDPLAVFHASSGHRGFKNIPRRKKSKTKRSKSRQRALVAPSSSLDPLAVFHATLDHRQHRQVLANVPEVDEEATLVQRPSSTITRVISEVTVNEDRGEGTQTTSPGGDTEEDWTFVHPPKPVITPSLSSIDTDPLAFFHSVLERQPIHKFRTPALGVEENSKIDISPAVGRHSDQESDASPIPNSNLSSSVDTDPLAIFYSASKRQRTPTFHAIEEVDEDILSKGDCESDNESLESDSDDENSSSEGLSLADSTSTATLPGPGRTLGALLHRISRQRRHNTIRYRISQSSIEMSTMLSTRSPTSSSTATLPGPGRTVGIGFAWAGIQVERIFSAREGPPRRPRMPNIRRRRRGLS